MKSLVITHIGDPKTGEIGRLALIDRNIPEPGEEDILIKVAYNGICGSDGHALVGNLGPRLKNVLENLPMNLGHECSGVVESVGEKAAKLGYKAGDRVVCNYYKSCGSCYYCRTGRENFCTNRVFSDYGASNYVCCHMSQVYRIPDDLPLKTAAMVEPFTIAFNAVETAKVRMGSRVAVFGGGGIGQIIVQLAKKAGASVVTMFEPVEEKRNLALSLGVDNAFNPITDDVTAVTANITNGLGYDSVIEASGSASAAKMALKILSNDGNVVYFSMYPDTFELPVNLFNEMYRGQKHIHGMFVSTDIWPRAISAMKHVQLEPLIQKEYYLEEYEEAFEAHLSGKYIKVMLKCNNDL